jgi:hypothetical protein
VSQGLRYESGGGRAAPAMARLQCALELEEAASALSETSAAVVSVSCTCINDTYRV